MGSKSKKKDRAKKRKIEDKIEITAPKKKCEEESVMDVSQPTCSTSENLGGILPTRQSASDRLCVAVRQKEFSIIEGPIGCGKSYLGVHAATVLGLSLKSMQMGDQVDSKSIFGSYHCTEVAGQFRWKQSTFTQWLSEPSLIVIEDIDLANSDVIAIFLEISRSRRITLPSGESVPFHEKARLVATMSGKGKRNNVLDGVPIRIRLEPLSNQELKRLMSQSFPRCAHLSRTLISIFRALEAIPATGNSRSLTSSDFLRGCARLNSLNDLSSNIEIFVELVDCWCLADQPQRAKLLCEKVAAPLTITSDQLAFHMSMRQPDFSHDDLTCSIGRCRLPRSPSLKVMQHHKLGHTRDVLQLMERIAVCVKSNESVLLVGETGVGKTSVVQALASTLNVTLKVVNLSPTSDSDELLEGYKPTTIANLIEPFTKFYYDVFTSNLDPKQNQKFLESMEACLNTGRYRDYLALAEKTASKVLSGKSVTDPRWAEVVVRARKIREGIEKNAAPFAITRGAVLEAAQDGHWLLVDEINLAPPECLDAIVHAISSSAHPNFRLFACMNPATDAGKRRLPTSVRTRFTEFYVSEMSDPHQLALVVSAYLPTMRAGSVENLVKFYLQAKNDFPGSYSLRTLCRALLFAADNMFGSEERSVYEAVSMAFLTNLDVDDKAKMRVRIQQTFRVATTVALPTPSPSQEGNRHVKIEGYWIECGTLLPKEDDNYVLTKTVKENLAEISRIVSSGRFPVLLEGETSAGKTSIVTHLGKATGNEVVRINNHEHTDIQEYMGSYVADEGGRLVFAEGALVKAVKNGSWVILDELNLAPTDVIEALNRLLDDNRELFIPELNKTIKAHPRFRLFATQNPAGTYSGRKRLSRALLSRFVVLRFHHLPMDELSSMVCTRCRVHPTAAEKMIAVLVELRNKRSLSGLFSARDGLMTLRDVFRWAKRLSSDETCDDWLQVLADHGYFLLAGRCRNKKDEATVVETLEKVLKRKIEKEKLFAKESVFFPKDVDTSKIVLTYGMRRMLVLTEQSWKHNEAVLMVGETGGGKTSLAETVGRGKLLTINCHERTETADLLGRLRPRDGGGFEWSDGVVISAMRSGAPLLIDEISLAEDSVLERLNPLFEEDRSLLLSDAGVEVHSVSAKEGYQMIATMNPGGDYGKKELSKALRNRFTEVWSSSDYESHELVAIFDNRLSRHEATAELPKPTTAARAVVTWIAEFFEKYAHVFRHAPSVRDVVACADLFSSMITNNLSEAAAVREALSAVFLDALASLPTRMSIDVSEILTDADRILCRLLKLSTISTNSSATVEVHPDRISVGWISVPFGPSKPSTPKAFSLKAPTCISNFYRIARGLLINKPILLEGPPGCGKSSTVMALAQLTGNPITRLNLSDQTDLSDLFGSDVPVVMEDGSISFQWEDGPVLRAIKKGEWVLLDEMNLASQSVLEGLNACFDHRRVLYIAELNKSFEIPDDSKCRFFACQNPRAQGGNRRALPKSFVNRFTSIWVDDLTKDDIVFILKEVDVHGILSHMQIHAMVEIAYRLSQDIHLHGGPFTFNLRDLLRWLQLYSETHDMSAAFDLLFVSRMRKEEDREKLRTMFAELFGEPCICPPAMVAVDPKEVSFGAITLPRHCSSHPSDGYLLTSQATLMYQLATAVKMHWLTLIVGHRNTGKQSVIENLSAICGKKLEKISLTSETDAQELIGSYEQVVDETAVEIAKAALTEALHGKIDDAAMKKLRFAEDLLALEIASELALSQVKSHPGVVEECREALARAGRADMHFSWVDSAFVRAFIEGHWLIIEDVNMCSAAVLDRLNSCLENDGKLVISERQSSFEPLEPHKDFRVFLTMDPRNGDISRAMRNRSLEIFVDPERSWGTSATDVASLATRSGKEIPQQIAEALATCPAEIQLQFFVLLNEMRVEEACRALNIEFDSEIQSEKPLISCTTVSNANSDKYLTWLVENWKGGQENDVVDRMFLCALGASSRLLKSSAVRDGFGEIGSRFAGRLLEIAKALPSSLIPIDMRFNSVACSDKQKATVLRRFVNLAVCEWALLSVESMSLEEGSAEHLSRTLTKYQMATSDRAFKNMQLVSGLVDAVMHSLREANFSGNEGEIFLLCVSLVLLLRAARSALSDRSGCAPMYLAWNYLTSTENISIDPLLMKVVKLMNAGWTAEAHEQFVTRYMKLYEKHRLVNAFESEEECNRLRSVVCPEENGEGEAMEVDYKPEDDEDENKKEPSAIGESLELVQRMENILRFISSMRIVETDSLFQSQKPLLTLQWNGAAAERFSRILALLNNSVNELDLKVLSLPSVGVFPFVYGSFWNSLHFDISMSSLTVQDLHRLTLINFTNQLWRLAPNARVLDERISAELRLVANGLEGWSKSEGENGSWKERLNTATQMINMSVPPPDTIDPIVYEEEKVNYLTAKLEIIERQLEILAEWRQATTRQDAICDSNSKHPVIATLFNTRQQLRDELDACITNDSPVYRQKASMYSSLCCEMRSFHSVTADVTAKMMNSDIESVKNADELRVLRAQLHSFSISANSFRQGIFSKFPSFVDVSTPFLTALEILLSVVYEVCNLLEARERLLELRTTTAFPITFKMTPTPQGACSSDLLSWSCRDASPMPLRLKAAVVRRRLASEADPMVDLEWVRREWKKWYEKNVAKSAEKDYIYRNKTEEEKEELELAEFFAQGEQENEILPTEDVFLLLNSRQNEDKESDARYKMALTWIRHLLVAVQQLPKEHRNDSADSDLSMLSWLSEREKTQVKGVLDVYRSASIIEFRKAANLLEALSNRTKEVLERWPEVVTLKLVLDAINVFVTSPLTTSHVRMSVLMENIIEQCEEWEKLADRANSLRDQLAPLREVLVEWKKMEIRSWSHLLSRTESDALVSAQLVAFPLFDALFKADSPDALSNVVAMCGEWLHSGTLLDFPARLESVQTLASWAALQENKNMSKELLSLAAHFGQYTGVVDKALKEHKDMADHSLQDYIRIAKYNDLNLWNIKVSSQKAHAHLFKIIKKFKAGSIYEASTHFDQLLDIEKLSQLDAVVSSLQLEDAEIVAGDEHQKRLKRACELCVDIVKRSAEICDITTVGELIEQVEGCDAALRTMINYDQYTEDEAKEKAQGYARNCRQRDVALVIKEGQAIGLNARRAITLKQEQITKESITGIAVESEREALLRACAGGRNVCIRKANQPNDQLGIATRKHFNGIVEYGMSWMMKYQARLMRVKENTTSIKNLAVAVERVRRFAEESWFIDHENLADRLSNVSDYVEELARIANGMKTRISMVPETAADIEESGGDLFHPLSLLHSEHAALPAIKQNVSRVVEIVSGLKRIVGGAKMSAVAGIFEKMAYTDICSQFDLDVVEMNNSLAELKEWFADEVADSTVVLEKVQEQLKIKEIETSTSETKIEPLLLFIQSLYKSLTENEEWKEAKLIDRFDLVANAVEKSDAGKIAQLLSGLVSDASVGVIPTLLPELSSLTRLASKLLSALTITMSSVLQSIGVLYYRILSMSTQLLEKGYVNTIPKDGKQESGDGRTEEGGDGGGMGEGKSAGDAKDVTDEMEETGQIEGLQDEEQEPPSGDKGDNEKPIDMEEDFAEDIQDIDRNEKGNDEPEGDDDEDEEPEAEDQMGDVDDADDTQLDPKLWDEEEEDKEHKDTDQDDAGADNKTDQMAAKEDDPLAAQQKEDENKEAAKEGDDEEQEEDMENADERDRENEGDEDESQTPEMDKNQTEMPQDEEDAQGGEEINMDEQMEEGEDVEDKGDEEEAVEGDGDEEEEEGQEGEDAAENPGEDQEDEQEDNAEAMEQGTGGERRENDAEKNEGGRNEDEEMEEDDTKEEDGKGESKSDTRGDKGSGAEAKEKEEKENEEDEEEGDEAEQTKKERQLATEDQEMVEAEEGEGEENDAGQMMEDAPTAERQMQGAGTMEEARKSKKEERKEENKPKTRKAPLVGAEETMDVPADENEKDVEEASAAIHLAPEDMFSLAEDLTKELVLGEAAGAEQEGMDEAKTTSVLGNKADAEKLWTEISRSVNILSAELAENLRLILEPQRASKMQGDYRTGKRLNMRRLIPYIASEYRKDRIWMRRTKRAQRDYQVLIAVDDSASMNENGIHQVTCESVCAIDDALRRCDAGAVSVCSFGSGVTTISAFGDQIIPGPEFIQKLSFSQSTTDLLALLNKSRASLAEIRTATSEQLLIIISDGRGALAQGADKVKQAIASLQGVTVLFVILDSGPKSISELSVASFKGGSVVLTPYLSLFPFPFYAVVKTVQQLPSVLAESIRQWFELTVQSG